MIVGAFYWVLLVFGGVLVLVSGMGVLVQFQDRPVDLAGIGFAIALGVIGAAVATYSGRALLRGAGGFYAIKAGPLFNRNRMAGSGCLFVLLVVGVGLLLSGPIMLVQVPEMAPQDQTTFLIGATISVIVGGTMAVPSAIFLWRGRGKSR